MCGEVTTLRQQLAQFEQLVRKMRSQEEDLTAMLEVGLTQPKAGGEAGIMVTSFLLQAKDTQAEVLRGQLVKADKTIEQLHQDAQDSSKQREK